MLLSFPDDNFFRFQDCPGYNNIQQHFKEMDVCWYDQNEDILYIIELKDWGDGVLAEEKELDNPEEKIQKLRNDISNHRIKELFKKTLDSVSMFISILLQKPYSKDIQSCSPFKITNETKIRILSIINWTNKDTIYISTVHSVYKAYFKPYGRLFGISNYVVMTKTQAAEIYPWVS